MTNMTRLAGSAALLALLAGAASAGSMNSTGTDGSMTEVTGMATSGDDAVTVGGAPMYPSKTIVENAVNSADHTTLVAAVKAAGLVDTLSGPGPFTVFAPTDEAFAALPEGTVQTLLEPANKDALAGVLTYHVVPQALSARELAGLIDANGGSAELTTVAGEKLTARMAGDGIQIVDAKGNAAMVTIADVNQSNGVIHVVDHVLLPG